MKILSTDSSCHLPIIMDVIKIADCSKGLKVFSYFFPKEIENVSAEEQMERWFIIHHIANEIGFKDVEKILKTIIVAYKKAAKGKGKNLTEEETYDVVQECLRNSIQETEIFNKFINAVIKNVEENLYFRMK